MKIIVDMFGGDFAPYAPLEGAAQAVAEFGVEIIAVGDEKKIEAAANEKGISLKGMTILHAPDVIDMEAAATDIVKKYPEASMTVGLKALAAGEGDAFVSAGSTGALLVGATTFIKRIKGVKRPALAMILPGKRPFLLMDCGANAEVRADMLLQFGIMGAAYIKGTLGRANPVVCLANNGIEEHKGPPVVQEAYTLMKACGDINFGGNIEAREIPFGEADVVVADGFTGNIILKLTEGLAGYIMGSIKEVFMKNFKTKIAAVLTKKEMREMKNHMDYAEHGGAPILGVAKPVIKAHGSSSARAFKNAIRQAKKFAESDSIEAVRKAVATQEEAEE